MLLQSGSAAGDCDGLQGAINRTYKKSHSPSGLLWFWALNLFPARRDEAAMVALKRNGWCARIGIGFQPKYEHLALSLL